MGMDTIGYEQFLMMSGAAQLMVVAEEGDLLLARHYPHMRIRVYRVSDFFVEMRTVEEGFTHLEIHAYTPDHVRFSEILCMLPPVPWADLAHIRSRTMGLN